MVDGNLEIQKTVVEALSGYGYAVVAAASGPEVMELLESEPIIPVLVLSDMVMPGGMTGLDIAAEVVARHPDCKAIIRRGIPTWILATEST